MFDMIVLGIFSILAFLGILWLVSIVASFFSKPEEQIYILVPVDETCEDVEMLVRAADMRARTTLATAFQGIVVLDNGMTEQAKCICERVSDEISGLVICDAGKLQTLTKCDTI